MRDDKHEIEGEGIEGQEGKEGAETSRKEQNEQKVRTAARQTDAGSATRSCAKQHVVTAMGPERRRLGATRPSKPPRRTQRGTSTRPLGAQSPHPCSRDGSSRHPLSPSRPLPGALRSNEYPGRKQERPGGRGGGDEGRARTQHAAHDPVPVHRRPRFGSESSSPRSLEDRPTDRTSGR